MENAESVRWDSHQNHLQTRLLNQLKQNRFCDVTLALEDGQTLEVHRAILCACSEYFDNILSVTYTGRDTVVILKDCEYEDVKLIIQYMYSGEISVKQVSTRFIKIILNMTLKRVYFYLHF